MSKLVERDSVAVFSFYCSPEVSHGHLTRHLTSHLAPRWLPGLAQRPITAHSCVAVWDSSNQPDGEREETQRRRSGSLSQGILGHVVCSPANTEKHFITLSVTRYWIIPGDGLKINSFSTKTSPKH